MAQFLCVCVRVCVRVYLRVCECVHVCVCTCKRAREKAIKNNKTCTQKGDVVSYISFTEIILLITLIIDKIVLIIIINNNNFPILAFSSLYAIKFEGTATSIHPLTYG